MRFNKFKFLAAQTESTAKEEGENVEQIDIKCAYKVHYQYPNNRDAIILKLFIVRVVVGCVIILDNGYNGSNSAQGCAAIVGSAFP